MGGRRSPFEVNRDNAEILLLAVHVVVKTSNLEISRWYWTDYVKKLN